MRMSVYRTNAFCIHHHHYEFCKAGKAKVNVGVGVEVKGNFFVNRKTLFASCFAFAFAPLFSGALLSSISLMGAQI